jgi:hypothetical protein
MGRAGIRICRVKRVNRVAGAVLLFLVSNVGLASVQVHDAISSPEPYNLPSLGYQATSTDEFGDHIGLAGTERELTSVRVGMSNWAKHSDHPLIVNPIGFVHELTLNLYGVASGGGLGSLFATKTVNSIIPWRPENNPGDNTKWLAPDGNTYFGYFFTVLFDFSADGITLPDELIATVAYNTQSYGESPIGVEGPYNSLNVALSPSGSQPTIGANVDPDEMFWDTSHALFYTDGGAGGVGILRPDTGWGDFSLAVEINANGAVPEATSFLVWSVLAMAAGGVGMCRRQRAVA